MGQREAYCLKEDTSRKPVYLEVVLKLVTFNFGRIVKIIGTKDEAHLLSLEKVDLTLSKTI